MYIKIERVFAGKGFLQDILQIRLYALIASLIHTL